MSNDDETSKRIEAHIFDSKHDWERYADIGNKVCTILEEAGLSEGELIPFIGFYLAHIMLDHLHCDEEMFRNNMMEFGRFAIFVFHKMAEVEVDDGDGDEGKGQVRH